MLGLLHRRLGIIVCFDLISCAERVASYFMFSSHHRLDSLIASYPYNHCIYGGLGNGAFIFADGNGFFLLSCSGTFNSSSSAFILSASIASRFFAVSSAFSAYLLISSGQLEDPRNVLLKLR
jgi:hypothetical protein